MVPSEDIDLVYKNVFKKDWIIEVVLHDMMQYCFPY